MNDPLNTLEGWLRVQPSDNITGTERDNLLDDIATACKELRRVLDLVNTQLEEQP
jgi:hypothetical protein